MFALKSVNFFLIGLFLAGANGVVYAQSENASFADFMQDKTSFFAGKSAAVVVSTELKQNCNSVTPSFYQIAGLLQTPVLPGGEITCRDASSSSGSGQLTYMFSAPSVKRAANFILAVTKCSTANANKDCKNVGETVFRVYPDNLLEKLKSWSQDNVLRVDGPESGLLPVLEKNAISYTSVYTAPVIRNPQAKVLTLLIQKAGRPKPVKKIRQALEYGHVIVFSDTGENKDPMLDWLPMVYHERKAERSMMIVNLPLISYLSGSPRAQSLFMDLITQTVQ